MTERRLTVRALIARLRKMPPTAFVAWQNHDQNETEIDGYAVHVDEGSLRLKHSRQDELAGHTVVVLSP